MLELKNINKFYKSKKGKKNHVLKDISISFGYQGMTFILGKSGSGKSTLLNILGGLDKYDSGDMTISGKSTKTFTEKEYDNYRNHDIGFIFQQFNILEDYNVYDNIALALKLQNKKVDDHEIQQLLKKLEIEDYQARKANELSGGEQQRVAIARALIKHPKIILADEPTGNLDSNTGAQVMDILKDISQDTLVIVVTHDLEFAKKYGDRILEIQDGVITVDSNNLEEIEDINDEEINSSKLPLWDAIKLGCHSLFHKKVKLIFSIVLITFSTIFLLFMYIVYTYDVNENHFRLIKEHKLNQVEIKKYSYSQDPLATKYTSLKLPCRLNLNDVNFLSNQFEKSYIVYKIDMGGMSTAQFLKLNLKEAVDLFTDTYDEVDQYTDQYMDFQLIELEQSDNLIEETIIGSFPEKLNEIMISNYLADLIIEYGIYPYESGEVFYPKNYEELIQSDLLFHFGVEDSVKIVGIIDYDTSEFQTLRGKKSPYIDSSASLLRKYTDLIYNKIYVKEGFIEELDRNKELTLSIDNQYSLEIANGKNLASFANSIQVIQSEIEYFDGKEWKTTDILNENELILNLTQILPDYEDYEKRLKAYISKYPNQSPLELEKEFLTKYYDFGDYIGNQYELEIYIDCPMYYQTFDRNSDYEYPVKVIGITGLLNSNIYGNFFSKNLLGSYLDSTTEMDGILVKEKNLDRMKKIVNQFPYNGKYSIHTLFSNDLENYHDGLVQYTGFIQAGAIVFLSFSVLLICNFMFDSISSKKKDIGILKSMGARNKDIMKIFLAEGVLLSIVSSVIATVGSFISFIYLNYRFKTDVSLLISPFNMDLNLILLMFFYILVIVCISSMIPLWKVSKMKPIDVIRNN